VFAEPGATTALGSEFQPVLILINKSRQEVNQKLQRSVDFFYNCLPNEAYKQLQFKNGRGEWREMFMKSLLLAVAF